ncbi:MAG: biopolymer transport protein ExbD [Acidobacteriota bacterium]|jgi:biopolymer transport protein ExbD|nr:biopolymer transport protein ExbD [Acidobacteriota bacterium]
MRDAGAANSTQTKPGINVTPLIDVLLVLLIIFMVLTPLRPARFKASVPGPPDDPRVNISPQTLIVSVSSDLSMKLLMGKTVVAEATVGDAGAVASRLSSEWRERKLNGDWKPEMAARTDLAPDERIERTVFIRAPRAVAYGEVARVIDAIKGAGAQPVGLQTDGLPE